MDNGDTQTPRQPKVWLISGSSRGLGRSIVTEALARGDRVIATARDASQLSCFQGNDNVKLLSLDVTDTSEALDKKVQEAIDAFGGIDVLVNNAGYVVSGVWEELSSDDVKQEFDTNFFGAMNLTRAVLPHMRRRRSGTILFMGSIAGWHSIAAGGAYSATKFAIEAAAESLAEEVTHLGIRVHVFVLGRFRTDILDSKSKRGKLDPQDDFSEYYDVKKRLADVHAATQGLQPGDPERAAARIVDVARLENLPGEQMRGLPLRIPLGGETIGIMRRKCEETMELLDGWAEFSASADYPNAEETPAYR
ncbi:hypothetical protein ACJ41O_005564 [Fusarium nematophilum]